MKEGLSAWPETVAYKRLLRNLIRAQDYVPPQQPTSPPLPEGAQVVAAVDHSNPPPPDDHDGVDGIRLGDWTIFQNHSGDVVARHNSGVDIVLPNSSEGNDRG
jgi:hypothetical protein